ncbi:phosphodiester glycosidase family protein [Fulvivirgaceae bacterium BMA12]|uniref:Phosphodiester glycosidase family protein n=1 Tax=Agaribacillus aureus TaxID=3051825 RepID=A0ABT8L2X9_9BACT|nr:phosphodiester glycosidase family protein [Fulvivirgaceae bacterium BMA12]
MRKFNLIALTGLLVGLSGFYLGTVTSSETKIISHIIDPRNQQIKFFWKDEKGENYKNFRRLKKSLLEKNEDLVFAMNGGMYNRDLSPQGLFIENGQVLAGLDTLERGYGNFYLQPNGVFFINVEGKATICETKAFEINDKIQYATQSGPLLLIDGKMHPKFIKGSKNVHIRNGVGILPDGKLLFAMSKEKINFYDFASYFMNKGCNNALYLDGFVSRTYLPEKDWIQLDGNFGVIIGEVR